MAPIAGSRTLVSVGTGVTAFLLVTAGLAAVLTPHIAFSVIVALPVGIAVGAVVSVVSWLRLFDDTSLRPILLGVSAVGYTLVGSAAVSYTVPAARAHLTVRRTFGVAGMIGILVAVVTRAALRADTDRRR